ncbi:hypothetical protein CISIN_1g027698mg [Citrus sinensis]|uniref:Very-long-chain (3R)-3-hydroxyacyl-CoA dehydratase n=1 Tax=Citrus sinensis TaxID=2711 RepID=A0A067G027_CITSI|nr:hypothetical protein CISIN_1g027698mg [Citrus sinensis]
MAHQRQPIKLYLFGYNSLQAAGWIVAIFMLLSNLLSTKSIAGTFASAGEIIWILQTAAFLEVVHGAVGILPSGVWLPFMQWCGRTLFFLVTACEIVQVQDHPSLFITFLAWCLIEVHYVHSTISYRSTWGNVTPKPSISIYEREKYLCKFLCWPPFQLLQCCPGCICDVSICLDQTLLTYAQATGFKTG